VKARFGKAAPERVKALHQLLRIPKRYREFLLECDPVQLETVTPAEKIRLFSSEKLEDEQVGFALTDERTLIPGPAKNGWRPAWILIGSSSLLGDPYFLDTSKPDPEGDCPVYTAMSGTETWQPKLCASSFALFLRILSVGLDVAKGFDLSDYDVDNEQVFREALGPKIRQYDPAATKAGHWT
jgi:hypothetical protein